MATICPTVTATGPHQYREQMERIEPFAERVHIDLMDGQFAPTKSPSLSEIWWLPEIKTDIHLMYQRPIAQLPTLIKLRPHLVIIHAEAEGDHEYFAESLHKVGIRVGLALLQDTSVESVSRIINKFNHVLIFSGHLGHHGGTADLSLLDKVREVRELHPHAEIGWDGGIDDHNIKQLVAAGVDVLNVGSFIQRSDQPEEAYATLKEVTEDS